MEQAPSTFLCCITSELMSDPVVTADGNTYERTAIEQWLRDHNTSPATGAVLDHTVLTPNLALRSAITEWMETHMKTIPRSAIEYSLPAIGVGSFKTVYKGTLTLPGIGGANRTSVAVMELRSGSVVTEVETFLKLGQHPRLVALLALCCPCEGSARCASSGSAMMEISSSC